MTLRRQPSTARTSQSERTLRRRDDESGRPNHRAGPAEPDASSGQRPTIASGGGERPGRRGRATGGELVRGGRERRAAPHRGLLGGEAAGRARVTPGTARRRTGNREVGAGRGHEGRVDGEESPRVGDVGDEASGEGGSRSPPRNGVGPGHGRWAPSARESGAERAGGGDGGVVGAPHGYRTLGSGGGEGLQVARGGGAGVSDHPGADPGADSRISWSGGSSSESGRAASRDGWISPGNRRSRRSGKDDSSR